jgi:hypothetical protein
MQIAKSCLSPRPPFGAASRSAQQIARPWIGLQIVGTTKNRRAAESKRTLVQKLEALGLFLPGLPRQSIYSIGYQNR